MKRTVDYKDLYKAELNYRKDKGNGVIVLDFLEIADEVGIKKKVRKRLLELEPNIYSKSNFMQKVVINRLLITTLLRAGLKYDKNVNIELMCCDILTPTNNWLGRLKELVLPTVKPMFE